MEQGQIAASHAISEVVMSDIEPMYLGPVMAYLKGLGCTVGHREEKKGYHITFPEGTMEEVPAGQSTMWTRHIIIRFPTGVRLTKYVCTPLNPEHPCHTTLAFPNDVLETERKTN